MKYVALLRGVNVGGNSKVDMKQLKTVFESLGFSNVRTYINSGNVIFETKTDNTAALIIQIEKAMQEQFRFAIRIVIRDAKNIQKLCREIPETFTNDTEQRTDVLFLWDEYATKNTLKLIAAKEGVDTLLYISSAIIWNIQRKNLSKSALRTFIGTEVYKHMTARNINTLRKLGELMK